MIHIDRQQQWHVIDRDRLTGLADDRHLHHAVQQAVASGRPWTVLFVDLDRFALVNERHGHAAGDAVLRTVAERLVARAGAHGIVARIGGDEFAVLFPDSGQVEVASNALGMIGCIEQPIAIDGATVQVGCTLGIGCALPGDDGGAVLAAADDDRAARKVHRRAAMVTTAH